MPPEASFFVQDQVTARFREIPLARRPPGASIARGDQQVVIDVVGATDAAAVEFVREYLLAPVVFEGQTLTLTASGTKPCINKYPGYSRAIKQAPWHSTHIGAPPPNKRLQLTAAVGGVRRPWPAAGGSGVGPPPASGRC
jgi:hypothetical protein